MFSGWLDGLVIFAGVDWWCLCVLADLICCVFSFFLWYCSGAAVSAVSFVFLAASG